MAGRDALVAGSIGPLVDPSHGRERIDPSAVASALREQLDGLLEGGVDLFMIETFSILDDVLAAVAEARRAADLPIVASLTFGEELVLLDGTTPRQAAAALTAAGVDVIGVNCGAGPAACLEALVRSGPAGGSVGRSILPNAGLPQRIEGQFVYAASPAYLGEMVPRLIAAGATHRRRLLRHDPRAHRGDAGRPGRVAPGDAGSGAAAATATQAPALPVDAPRTTIVGSVATGAADDGAPPPTGLAERLAAGRFVVSVEIDPPRSIRIERTIEAAGLLRDAGVDLVNVSDSAMARVRMGCLAVAFGIQHDLDLECLVHFTTRDRNLMAARVGAARARTPSGSATSWRSPGTRPGPATTRPGTGVWDVDSIGLIEILARLNRGEDGGGLAHRPAGRVHDRLRARPDRRRPGDRVGPPRAQDRRPAPT